MCWIGWSICSNCRKSLRQGKPVAVLSRIPPPVHPYVRFLQPAKRPPIMRATNTAAPVEATPTKTPRRAGPRKVKTAGKTATGFLSVRARPWVAVSVDGERVADETPLKQHELGVGRAVLLFENSALGFRKKKVVRIRADRETRIFVDVANEQIRVD